MSRFFAESSPLRKARFLRGRFRVNDRKEKVVKVHFSEHPERRPGDDVVATSFVSGSRRTLLLMAGKDDCREMYKSGELTEEELLSAGLEVKWLYEPDLTSEEIEQALHRAGFEEDEHEDDYQEEDEEEGEWLAFRPPLHLAPQPDEIVDLVVRPLETYVEFVPLTEVAEDWLPDALWRRGILNVDLRTTALTSSWPKTCSARRGTSSSGSTRVDEED